MIPDILTLGKALGGGMPIGALVSSKANLHEFTYNPMLGHITTFGGHPVSCAASIACIEVIEEERLLEDIADKEQLFRKLLQHPKIIAVRGKGLLLAVEFATREFNFSVNHQCLQLGVFVDWFLFNDQSLRIAPPLTISASEIQSACEKILQAIKNAEVLAL